MTQKPVFNVPFSRDGMMTQETYALLSSMADAIPENAGAITMKSPDGTSWNITVSNAGALVVSPT